MEIKDLGICVLENLANLKHSSVKELINTKRHSGGLCFVFFPHEWEKRANQIRSHIATYSTQIKSIYARKCVVKEISSSDIRAFCNLYHIQGSNRLCIVGWGLFFNDELIGILSLGRHHRQSEDVLLDRLCFKDKIRVVGGASKLFSAAQKWAMEHSVPQIVSFSDNRWSIGTVYEKLGFQFDKELPPDYFYVSKDDYLQFFSKQSQKKSNTNCPTNMTEKEWCALRGLLQVYDAGKKRWIYKVKLQRDVKSMVSRRHGYYETKKAGKIYYQSSYELRAATLLDEMENVKTYSNQVKFVKNGKKRYIDFLVTWTDGSYTAIEIKPLRHVEMCSEQIDAHRSFAIKQGWKFTIWTEKELGFTSEYKITLWADQFLSTIKPIDFVQERKRRSCEKTKTYYQRKIATDTVTIWCEYCQENHTALRLTYDKNIARNGRYICEREGGHISGSKPKLALRKENPYAAEGKKKCNKCGDVKLFEDFSPDKSKTDGYSTRCKTCRAGIYKEKYQQNKKDIKNN